ncbi:hypothetical protein MCHI_001687 [Candidatus Magnetoovum chiemensis]|nr:hypothetical protein MCHI_001687 [Candidatus Magnetoovum chiemensis]
MSRTWKYCHQAPVYERGKAPGKRSTGRVDRPPAATRRLGQNPWGSRRCTPSPRSIRRWRSHK